MYVKIKQCSTYHQLVGSIQDVFHEFHCRQSLKSMIPIDILEPGLPLDSATVFAFFVGWCICGDI